MTRLLAENKAEGNLDIRDEESVFLAFPFEQGVCCDRCTKPDKFYAANINTVTVRGELASDY